MGDQKATIHKLLLDYYKQKGLEPTLQVAKQLLKKPVVSKTDLSTADLSAIFNGEVCETVLNIMIADFMKRNPKKTASWRYCKGVILSDLETRSNKFLTEIDTILFTPGCFYIFECKSYSGNKTLTGKGTIERSNGNNCNVYSQNVLHLKIVKQWLDRFSRHPKYQMALFDFSSGSMTDQRDNDSKKVLPLVNTDNLFSLLRESRLEVWKPDDIAAIYEQFSKETEALRKKHLSYVKSLNH